MNYTLYLAAASNDRYSVYSFLLANYTGVIDKNVFIAVGERRFDESYCGHIALQRALRRTAQAEGIISLQIVLDQSVTSPLGYELLGASPPLYPGLERTTQRILKRFQKVEFASTKPDEDALPEEIAVVDDAVDALEQVSTPIGRLKLLRDRFLKPSKIIQ